MLRRRIAVKIAFFVNGFVFASWVARLPRMQELYSLDDGQTGLVLLASSVGAVSAMPFTGWIIIRNGSNRITIAAAAAYCILVPLMPLMPGMLSLLITFLMIGIATGVLDVAMNAQAIMVEQEYKRSIITSFHAMFSIGMMIGAGLSALFTDAGIGITQHLLMICATSLVAVAWMSRNLVHDRPDPQAHHDGPLFRLPNRSLVSIGIISFCCMIAEGSMSDWSVNYMENIVGASKTLAPFGLSAFATAMTLGRLFGDKARTSFGDKMMIASGGLLTVVGLILSILFPVDYITISAFFLVGIGLSTIIPIAYSIAGNEPNLPSGVGLAMVTTVGYTGFLVGPPLIGFVADAYSLTTAFILVTVLVILMTVLGRSRRTDAIGR